MKKKTRVETDCIPRVTITLTEESIFLTRHDRMGAPAATYPVAAADVANAFNEFGASTGLLPPGALFWQSHGGQLRIGVWIGPGKRTIHLRNGKRVENLRVPLPGLVFVGHGREYRVFAARSIPQRPGDLVYQCPLPNVYGDGRICPGNVPFPKCGAETMSQAIELFFESEFNHDLAGHDTMDLLKSLNGQSAFPLEKLRPGATIGEVIADRAGDDGSNDDEYDAWNQDVWFGDGEEAELEDGMVGL